MAVERVTPTRLMDRYGGTERYWERRRPAMVRLGLLNKIGRYFFGDLERIDDALMSAEFGDAVRAESSR